MNDTLPPVASADSTQLLLGLPRGGLFRLSWRAAWIAGIYAVLSLLWIFFSDRALLLFGTNPDQLIQLSVYKGFAFVSLTALLIFLMLRKSFGTIGRSFEILTAHEREIDRLNRLNTALSRVNQAISRHKNRKDLFSNVCQVLGEQSGFGLVWIGTVSPDRRILSPVAEWGDEEGTLRNLEISLENHERDSRTDAAPDIVAFLEDRSVISNRMLHDTSSPSWKNNITRKGIRASASFPIHEADQVVGTLSVYAKEGDFFKEEEIRLLEEVAKDLSFALDTYANREIRRLAEQQAENERAFSNTMIESMPGILYFYDEAGRFLRWNRNFELVSGYTGAEVAGMQPLDFFPPDEKERLQTVIEDVFERGESSAEAHFKTRTGELIPHYFTGKKVVFNQQTCLVGMGVDISERIQAEEDLRKLNNNLEKIIDTRTGELQRALVQAEAADRLKSAFLATMSHELRTPLNSIIGFTGILQQGMAGEINPEQYKQLGMVRSSARHLLELINDVLDISKIEAGQLEVRSEPFVLNAVIEEALALVHPQIEEKGLHIHSDLPAEALALKSDPRRVKQILLNLLNNAVKFTEQGSIRIEVEQCRDYAFDAGDRVQPAVRIRVSDTGIGIDPHELETIFRPFQQIDSGISRQHEGTGLGLAICQRLAELMGGEVAVESVPSKGSQFTLSLPCSTYGRPS